jgi:hypothetical protein
VALPPPQIINFPETVYGIAYDLFYHDIQDDLPDGWSKWRCMHFMTCCMIHQILNIVSATVYRQLHRYLRLGGFVREQYSVFQRFTTAIMTWTTMMHLRNIPPRGVLATVVRRMEMFAIPLPNIFIVTNDIRLGGFLSPGLLGPTPAGLAQGLGAVPPPPWPNGPGDELPLGVRALPPSFNPNNWRM